ncbi:PMS1 protein homolog 1 [Chanos chanos]|uniref:PMS1 protein homolog 1 n=1 Tax=Chanos chanos TaxID=29144 RepID=A0A6J2WJI0_CHACN|nr:PMS1 protein homolog 1 [Chanos chanos]
MNRLSAETVRILSSSQVITSVTNVVKELIENSLDAGSTTLEIKLENYGLDRIEVRDNGSGIKTADTAVMAVKHYTSKISCHDDLQYVTTYGFRGEALASICAVSEVVVTTKTADDDVSTQYTLDVNGQIVSKRPSHLGQGTTVCAQMLFKNLPVRRQYYSNTKKCKEELKKVQDLVMAYGIIIPGLRIVLTHNKAVVWQKARVSDHRAALMAVLGASCVTNMLPLQHGQELTQISIDGYFPKPGSDFSSMSCSSPDKTFVFVNKRPVQHREILKLVRQYYANAAQAKDGGSTRRFPISMMNITVPSTAVDVNLTPDKTQVMLLNKDDVLSEVEKMLTSLYGPIGDDNVTSGPGPSLSGAEQDQCKSTALVDVAPNDSTKQSKPLPQPTSDHSEPAPLGKRVDPTAIPLDPVGETSANHSANISSSSSSEDWIISQSSASSDSGGSSLFAEGILLNSTVDEGQGTSKDSEKHLRSDGGSGLTAESWSMGKAFADPATGNRLEPVRLHLPGAPKGSGPIKHKDKSGCQSKKPSNIFVEKMPQLTIYDLINNRPVRRPQSAMALFEEDDRWVFFEENPGASINDFKAAVKERWESLREEDRKKYEEKAEQSSHKYDLQTKRALEGETRACDGRTQPDVESAAKSSQSLKRKAPERDQEMPGKAPKKNSAKPSSPLPFSVAALKHRLNLLSQRRGPGPQGLRLVNRLTSHSAWVVLCGRKLMLLNPFRVEEALLFKRLQENNILPAVSLQIPIQLTDGDLGGSEYMDVLLNMQKASPGLNGEIQFTDSRLVANGFHIRLLPGCSSSERHVEITAMADCLPFFGVPDLREILTAVRNRDASSVAQCRPLKVVHYLEGEAVRLARQLPLNLSKEDVTNTLSRMKQELEDGNRSCFHGRPFFHELIEIPDFD